MKKEEKLKVGRPKLADTKLKKKSVIISCICLVASLALLITGAFELNILKFNTGKLKGTVNTNLCGTDINIIPEELRYSESNPDGFKDIKFYSAVLSAGGYNNSNYCSTITKESLRRITSLSLDNYSTSDYKFKDVSGIGYLINLKSLRLYNNQLTDIDLTNLTNLASLNLDNNQLTDIDLTNLTNLNRLYLNNNKLTSIDVNNLTNLTSLDLGSNPIKLIDLSNIKLEQIYDGNGSPDFHSYAIIGSTDLEKIILNGTSLKYLKINNSKKLVIEGLEFLSSLSKLDLSNNNLSGDLDLSNIKFDDRAELYLDNNKLDSLKIPGGNYSSINLNNNNLKSIEFIKPVSTSDLILYNNQLTNVDLSNVNNLQYLYLSNNKLTSVDVSNLISLEELFLDNNSLTKIDGLSNLNNLVGLYAHNNKLESIDLSGVINLQGVTLQNNPFGNTRYLLKGKTIDYKDIVNASDITFSLDNENIGSFDVSVLKTKEVGTLNVTASAKSLNEWAIDGRIMSIKIDYLDKCLWGYDENHEYCNNVSEDDYLLPYFYENKVIIYDVLSNNYKVDGESKTIDVSGLIPDTKYITLTEGLNGEIKNNKYIVKNSNNEVIEEFTILNPGKKEEEVKKVTTTTKSSSKRVIKPNKKVTTKKLEDINLTGSFISSMMLNQVRGQDRKLTVTNEDVTLTMLGKDIKKIDSNIDISYTITDVKETEVKDKVEEGVVLDFVNKTTLPCTSQVEVNVKDKITGTVDIYRYENGTLVLIAENVRITDNKLTFNTDKLDTYVITNKLKKDVEVKEDKALVESNKKFNNKCLIIIPIIAIILLIGIGTYIYKKKMAK